MQNDGYKIIITIEPNSKKHERFTKYKCCYYEIVKDDVGKRYLRARKVSSYDSIDTMEQDIEGFTLFYEYEGQIEMEDVGYDERNDETAI